MTGHDRFEALAGAIALGEATPAERTCYDAHAVTCAACGDDAASGVAMRAAIENARDGEMWRPSVTREVRERIARSRGRRTRATVVALGWAIAFSFALDVAFVSGTSNRIETGLRDSGVALSSLATSFARTSPTGDVGFR